jgi:SAM-dependent methyltransferase
MQREDWDARYAASDLVWGIEPNRFVAEAFAERPAFGHALDLACGEGRNAIWLASLGWSVTAVDFSGVALERARSLAERAGVVVDWVLADVAGWRPEPGAFDLVLISYLQVPPGDLRAVVGHAASALRAGGGELFMIGHAVRNLEEGVGGPRDVRVLWDPDTLAGLLREHGLAVDRCEEVLRPVADGDPERPAIDVLAQARRP